MSPWGGPHSNLHTAPFWELLGIASALLAGSSVLQKRFLVWQNLILDSGICLSVSGSWLKKRFTTWTKVLTFLHYLFFGVIRRLRFAFIILSLIHFEMIMVRGINLATFSWICIFRLSSAIYWWRCLFLTLCACAFVKISWLSEYKFM